MSVLRRNISSLVKWAAVIAIAAALKIFYSQASVNELRWILAPTTVLVEWATWSNFTFEPYSGYMNREHTFLIAAPCSGVNFLIAAFLMLALRTLWNDRPARTGWSSICRSAAIAFAATVAANAVRISIALETHELPTALDWMDEGDMHRLQGIIVYFGSLLVLFLLTDEPAAERSYPLEKPGLMKRSLWPLAIYYAVTLGIPLVNGASGSGNSFWRHSLIVLLIPIVLLSMLAIFRWLKAGTRNMRAARPARML